MRAGKLRNRGTLQKRNEASKNSYGEIIPAWETSAVRWVQIKPLRGKELLEANKVDGRITHKLIFRWVEPITPDMRMIVGTRSFNIFYAILVDERKIMTEAMAQEITASTVVLTVSNFDFMDGTNFDFMDGTNFDFI